MTDKAIIEKKPQGRTPKPEANEPIEKQGWEMADKLLQHIDAAEYKHIVLGLVSLQYTPAAAV